MGTPETCLLIMAIYTLVLLIIAAWYSTKTIDTLGELVHQLINKIDAHNETVLRGIRALIAAITGQPDSSENEDDKNEDDKSSSSTVKDDMQYLYENLHPSTWTSFTRRYEPVDRDDTDEVDVSKTTVMNPYDEHNVTRAS